MKAKAIKAVAAGAPAASADPIKRPDSRALLVANKRLEQRLAKSREIAADAIAAVKKLSVALAVETKRREAAERRAPMAIGEAMTTTLAVAEPIEAVAGADNPAGDCGAVSDQEVVPLRLFNALKEKERAKAEKIARLRAEIRAMKRVQTRVERERVRLEKRAERESARFEKRAIKLQENEDKRQARRATVSAQRITARQARLTKQAEKMAQALSGPSEGEKSLAAAKAKAKALRESMGLAPNF